jgi:glycine/D-amino acid oxidase-like deaminating enzyme
LGKDAWRWRRAHRDGIFARVTNTPAWDTRPWTPLPPLPPTAAADVCVVGLGGTGLTCISELLARGGRSVIGVDAHDVGAGAAGRNGGLLLAGTADNHHDAVRTLGRDAAVDYARRTEAEIDRFVIEYPDLVRRTGSLRIAASDDELADCAAQYDAMRADGLGVARYDGPEGRGLLFPDDAVFQPLERCRVLATRVQSAGARLFGDTRVIAVAPRQVHTARGTIVAEQIIVCVDGRLEVLLPALAGEVRTARLQMLGTAPELGVRVPRPVYFRYGYDYWQQLPDQRIVLGGGRDIAVDDEWTPADEPTNVVQSYLDHLLRDHLGVTAAVTHRWAASVSYTQTGLPVCRAVDRDVWAIGGFSGTGNVMGALLARDVAAHVAAARHD